MILDMNREFEWNLKLETLGQIDTFKEKGRKGGGRKVEREKERGGVRGGGRASNDRSKNIFNIILPREPLLQK